MTMIKRLVLTTAAIGGAILMMVFVPDVASAADKRVALIVGNSSYQTVPQLPNPAKDAAAVAKLFKDAGFDHVEVQLNVGNMEFKRSIRRFQDLADEADIAVIYYAGHGLEIGGTNYLIPVDAKLASDRDADDEAIPLERLVAAADGANHLRLIILDACRDNPFIKTMHRKVATRSTVVSGLGKVEPTSTDTLIAYASKAGSTADDGDGEHSPFTTSLLKNLTVPGLDVRLAFGRVKDEVMKSTGGRQEPFVYGSLGGNTISLVPPPPVPQEASAYDIRADYELVDRVGTARAWQAFLSSHPTGLYADLARAQLEKLGPPPAQGPQPNMVIAALPPPPSSRDNPSKESIEWDRLKDSTDPAALLKFIKKFPDSQQSIYAKQRMDVLTQAAQEREKAAEAARLEAEQKKAELAAAKKREDDERRAKAAEAEQQAKAAAAELAIAKKREEDERRAKAAEAEQQAKAAEAERKAAEAKQKAEEAQKSKAAAEAAALRAASEKQAREAEEARRKAELASAQEAACKNEQGKLDQLTAKGSDGTGIADLTSFSKTITCDRLRPVVVATLGKFNVEAAKRAAALPNSLELVRAAQGQLARLGCFTGRMDGNLITTKTAVGHYLSVKGKPTDNTDVTEGLVADLTKQSDRVCPVECQPGQVAKGDNCVAVEKPVATAPTATPAPVPAPTTASRRKNDDDDKPAARKPQPKQAEAPRPRPAPEAPQGRQQAAARPAGGGGGHPILGVGF
jgi:hypothetical protein